MTTERELREKLRKIAALFEGASTAGEREAAAAASKRVLAALNAAEKVEPSIEMQFSLSDRWSRLLFYRFVPPLQTQALSISTPALHHSDGARPWKITRKHAVARVPGTQSCSGLISQRSDRTNHP